MSDDLPGPLRGWLETAARAGASDLHLVPGYPPVLRLHGDLVELGDARLTAADAAGVADALCPADDRDRFRTDRNLDRSLEVPVDGRPVRFRVNLFHAGQHPAACLRLIPTAVPSLEWAGFPDDLADRLTGLRDGLVIVTGPTGHGKTTTLAMLVQRLNQTGGCRIITVEEPVEYVFAAAAGSVVTQREVGADVLTFADGLKYGLRQDPDVILVGEVRDRETAQMALSAAETGQLVLTTLHTRDAKGAVTRYADLFPPDGQATVRSQLALSLRAVVAQRLLPGAEKGEKRRLALEVLWVTSPVASAIRTGKVEGIDNYLVTGRAEGMVTFDESVRRLLIAGAITPAVAERNVSDAALLYRSPAR